MFLFVCIYFPFLSTPHFLFGASIPLQSYGNIIRWAALPWSGGEDVNQAKSWTHALWNFNLQQSDKETQNGQSSCIPPWPALFQLGLNLSFFLITSKPDSPATLLFLFVLRSCYHSKNSFWNFK